MNIGPRADGTITDEQKAVLLSIGKWLKVNGEAIYGTRCWKKFGEGDTEATKGAFSDNAAIAYTAQDMRFTTKDNDLYAIILNWSDNGTLIKSLNKESIADAKIVGINLLGSDEKIDWKQTDEGLKISFPQINLVNMPIHLKYLLIRKLENILNQRLSMNKVVKYNPKN